MELEGKISVVMPASSGVSQTTGNPWMSQEYVMAYYWFPNQTNPSYIVMRVFGEDRIKQFNLQENDEVRVRFHIEAHEYNGRWFNDIRAFRIDRPQAAPQAAPQFEVPVQAQAAPIDTTPFEAPSATDDLPF